MLRQLHRHPGRDAWQTVMWYDQSVPAAKRDDLPTLHPFRAPGQVMMLPGWRPDATPAPTHARRAISPGTVSCRGRCVEVSADAN